MVRSAPALVSVVIVTLGLAGCGGRDASSGRGTTPARSAAGGSPGLSVATGFLPPGASGGYIFQFADWGSIEGAFGLTPRGLTSTHAAAELSNRLKKLGVPPSGEADFDLAANSGAIWAATDVAWDASIRGSDSPPVSVTGFHPQFALSGVEQRLASCGFTSKPANGALIYTGSLSDTLNCTGALGDKLPGTATSFAFEPQTHVVVFGSPAAVSGALANQALHRAPDTVVQALLGGLAPASAVALGVGPKLCRQLSQPAFLAGRNFTPQTVARAQRMYLPAAAWEGFGFSYIYSGSSVTGRLGFTYGDARTAQADLPAREHTLRTSSSLITAEPYSRSLTVQSGQVTGRTAVIRLRPAANGRLALGSMLNNDDLGFARCG